jgi:hypothetical protein
MIKLRALFTCALLAVTAFGLLQQSSRIELTYHEYLGFSLMPGANSTAVSFHIVKKWDDPTKPIEAVNISQQEFMRIASGFIECGANPKKENLFAANGMVDCGWFNDTIINGRFYESGNRCNTMNDIWRLRYQEWPFYIAPPRNANANGGGANTLTPYGPGPGWARKPLMPSDGQLDILRTYGTVDPMVDVIWGPNAFRLLKDMQDAGWVTTYRGS